MSQFMNREMITTVTAIIAVLGVIYLLKENKKIMQRNATTEKNVDDMRMFIQSAQPREPPVVHTQTVQTHEPEPEADTVKK